MKPKHKLIIASYILIAAGFADVGYQLHGEQPVRIAYKFQPLETRVHDCTIPALAAQIESLPALKPFHERPAAVQYVMNETAPVPGFPPRPLQRNH